MFDASWDHPRLCGEKMLRQKRLLWIRGSPPPMRGKADFLELWANVTRITPAYAGKSYADNHDRFG